MSLLPVNLQLRQAAVMASSFTTPNIGGGLGTLIADNSANSLFFPMNSNAVGGSNIQQVSNAKWYNANADAAPGPYPLTNTPVVYLANSLDANTAAGTFTVVSDSALDNGSYYVHGVGLDGSGNPIDQAVTMNGVTPAASTITFGVGGAYVFEFRAAAGGALTNSNGNITISVGGQVLGIIPIGRNTAISFVQFALDSALNTTGTVANARTLPTGLTWSKARTVASGVPIPGGSLPASSYITVWLLWTLPAGLGSAPAWQTALAINGGG